MKLLEEMTELCLFIRGAFKSSYLELRLEDEVTLDEVLGRLDRRDSIVDTCGRSR